jgi:hypothetical protein
MTTEDDIRADIEQTRTALGESVEALVAKTDVKARTRDAVDRMGGTLRQRAGSVAAVLASLAAVAVAAVLIGRWRAAQARSRNRWWR